MELDMIILDPNEYGLTATIFSADKVVSEPLTAQGDRFFDRNGKAYDISRYAPVGILLRHGAGMFNQSVTRLEASQLPALEECLPYHPDLNKPAYQAARACLNHKPETEACLLCDTAYFSSMPESLRRTALPEEYAKRGILRFGGDGFFHQKIWQQVKNLRPKVRRLINVHLGEESNVAAVLDGQPVETSIGFSPAEGIPSATCCGNMDASIPLMLAENGFSTQAIRQILTQRSGIQAITSAESTPAGLMETSGTQVELALAILESSIVKAIGTAAAALGGVDAICFGGENSELASSFPIRITRRLGLLGVSALAEGQIAAGHWEYSAAGTPVLGFSYNRPDDLAEQLSRFLGSHQN
jgi:acetate kinase